jgi:hypothetical protein
LQFQRQIADFVQEQCASIRGLKSPDSLRDRACESSTLVSEQLTFEQASGNSGAVYRHESLVPTGAGVVNLARNHFLAGPGFAEQQHRAIHGRYHGDRLDDFSKRQAVTNELTSHVDSSFTDSS